MKIIKSVFIILMIIVLMGLVGCQSKINKEDGTIKDTEIDVSDEIDKVLDETDNDMDPKQEPEDDHELDDLDDIDKIDDIEEKDDFIEEPRKPITMAFAGDILFADNSVPINKYDSVGKGVDGILSENLLEKMRGVHIMMLNNEFAYSTRGSKIPDKTYTFRAHPDRVNILHDMGVDIVSLANNHSLDYGQDALLDTFDVLDQAGIPYVGAGKDINRAKAAIYLEAEDYTIGFLSASRVIYAMDWYATEDRPGMLGTYDPEILLKEIEEAREKCDYLVVFVHWGIEGDNYPQEYQKNLGRAYIDSGADIVIGAHPHVVQGFEYYKGKPIVYSLGNFWFSSYNRESALLQVTINPDHTVETKILPVFTGNCYTYLSEDEKEIKEYYKFMEKLSFDIDISSNGVIKEREKN